MLVHFLGKSPAQWIPLFDPLVEKNRIDTDLSIGTELLRLSGEDTASMHVLLRTAQISDFYFKTFELVCVCVSVNFNVVLLTPTER